MQLGKVDFSNVIQYVARVGIIDMIVVEGFTEDGKVIMSVCKARVLEIRQQRINVSLTNQRHFRTHLFYGCNRLEETIPYDH